MDLNKVACPETGFLIERTHGSESDDGPVKRKEFAHDRDRIIHSRAFRRLMHKTQVFNANKGDHFRNRLTHTLEVMQIARTIGRALALNEDLIEAIALGHDLGHTPFGHIGERTLHDILANGIALNGVDDFGKTSAGFKHNFQSVRVVEQIETRCDEYSGINLTFAVREGILKHTKIKRDNKYIIYPEISEDGYCLKYDSSITLEGQVVAVADEIAQVTHDVEDGIRGDIIKFEKIYDILCSSEGCSRSKDDMTYNKKQQVLKKLVGILIEDVCKFSNEKIEQYCKEHGKPSFLDRSSENLYTERCVWFSESRNKLFDKISTERNIGIIRSQEISQSDSKSEYMIKQIFKAYVKHPMELPDYVLSRYLGLTDFSKLDRSQPELQDSVILEDTKFFRIVCDHIAGMTDQYAAREYKKLYEPEYC